MNTDERTFTPTNYHISRLLVAIHAIQQQFTIPDEAIEEHLPEAAQAIDAAQQALDPTPHTVLLLLVFCNGDPINAWRDKQQAINYITRVQTQTRKLTHGTYKVSLRATDDLLVADLYQGQWVLQPHDDHGTYTQPLLLIPIC